jgi:lia operon protein LiaG
MVFISLSGDFFNFIMSPFNGDRSNLKTIRTTKIEIDEITNLDLSYTYGSVYISSYEGNEIIIEEKSNKNVNNDELFKIEQNNETLYLKQPTSINIFNFFGFINKKMVRYIKLPTKVYNQIKTNFTSGNFNVENIDANTFDMKMTSGKMNISDINSKELDVDITSGNVDIIGSFEDISAYATSGNIDIKSDAAPSKLLIDITSGNASVTIPDNDGFILSKNKTSGSFHSDFRLDDYNTYKNGQNKYKIKMTSGRINLLRAD